MAQEYYEDDYYDEEIMVPPSASWLDAIQDQFGPAPWWIISALVHVLIILLSMMMVVARQKQEKVQEVFTNLVEEEQEEPEEKKDIQHEETVEEVEPIITHEVAEEDHMETEDDMDMQMAHGDEDAISDIPMGGTGTVGWLGTGGGGAGMFGYRSGGGRRKALRRGGGSKATEEAVNRALAWLARHQEPEGHWDGEKYEGEDSDSALTGLAALAFLGAGHTERVGKYKDNVRRAVNWMISQQEDNGCIGKNSRAGGLGYHHAICGMALSEAYAMAKVERTGRAAQKAVDYSVNVHQVPYSGWRYNPRQDPDTSVTGWFVMQLKSAKVAKLKVPGEGFQGAINWLDKVTDTENYSGRCGYREKSTSDRGITSVGLVCRLFMGWKPNDPLCRGAAEFLVEKVPSWGDGGGSVNFYYWYYGTLGIFQVGEPYWSKWNEAMKKSLLTHQRRGGDEDGSWDPVGKWCPRGGRVYSTAMGALCLEVYYRYLPMYR